MHVLVRGNVESGMAHAETCLAQSPVLVVVPTYNERDNIQSLISDVLRQDPRIDILVIDDDSPDGTGTIVAELAGRIPRVHLIRRSEKLGLGTAYIAGFQFALAQRYELILEMDADFSHSPEEIPRFLKAMEGDDVVIGSRYIRGGAMPGWSAHRRHLSRAANTYIRWVTGLPLHDATSGYRCFRRQVLERIDLPRIRSQGYGFQVEVAYRIWKLGFRIVETPIIFVDRTKGNSKLSWAIIWEALWIVWRLRLGV